MIMMIKMGSFVIWAQINYKPTKETQTYVQAYNGKNYIFGQTDSKVVFVLYQGAKIDPQAYSYLALSLEDRKKMKGLKLMMRGEKEELKQVKLDVVFNK